MRYAVRCIPSVGGSNKSGYLKQIFAVGYMTLDSGAFLSVHICTVYTKCY